MRGPTSHIYSCGTAWDLRPIPILLFNIESYVESIMLVPTPHIVVFTTKCLTPLLEVYAAQNIVEYAVVGVVIVVGIR